MVALVTAHIEPGREAGMQGELPAESRGRGKAGSGAGDGAGCPRDGEGAGGRSSLTLNHRKAAVLGCEQNKSHHRGLLKSNVIWCHYHRERHAERLGTAGELQGVWLLWKAQADAF